MESWCILFKGTTQHFRRSNLDPSIPGSTIYHLTTAHRGNRKFQKFVILGMIRCATPEDQSWHSPIQKDTVPNPWPSGYTTFFQLRLKFNPLINVKMPTMSTAQIRDITHFFHVFFFMYIHMYIDSLKSHIIRFLLFLKLSHTFYSLFIVHVGKILKYVPSFRHRTVNKHMAVVWVISI